MEYKFQHFSSLQIETHSISNLREITEEITEEIYRRDDRRWKWRRRDIRCIGNLGEDPSCVTSALGATFWNAVKSGVFTSIIWSSTYLEIPSVNIFCVTPSILPKQQNKEIKQRDQ